MQQAERSQCGVCAARLAGQEPIGWLAMLFTGTALFALVSQGWSAWWSLVVMLGLAERYAAARVAIDASLLRQLAGTGLDLAGMDAALSDLKIAPAVDRDRALGPRLLGALAWVRRHSVLVAAQAACTAAALGAR